MSNKNAYKQAKLIIAILLFKFILCYQTSAQNDDIFQEQIELILSEENAESFDYLELNEKLEHYLKHPINLNKTNKETLVDLGLLSTIEINAILNHIAQFGKLISVYELQSISLLKPETIKLIAPYISVGNTENKPATTLKKLLFGGTHALIIGYQQTLPKKQGYLLPDSVTNSYLGNPARLYFRYKYQFANRLSYGFTAEKDPGEQWFSGSQKQGFDFYSGHLYLHQYGIVNNLVIGDFQAQLGQGLIHWNSFGFGKSSYVINVKKQAKTIKPYTSLNEVDYLRGAAIEFKKNHIYSYLFASVKQTDGNVNLVNDTLETEVQFSLNNNLLGKHRTPNEIAKKNQLIEQKFGFGMKYQRNHWHLGLNTVYTRYNKPLNPTLKPYQQFQNFNQQYAHISVDYHYVRKNIHLFGETALSLTDANKKPAFASLNGFIASVDKSVDFTILHRFFSKQFLASPYAKPFSETNQTTNEHGLYLGIASNPIHPLHINAYFDIFHFNWLRYNTSGPTWGRDFLIQAWYQHKKTFKISWRYKDEMKQQNATGNEQTEEIHTNVFKRFLRFQLEYKPQKTLRFISRFETSFYNNKAQNVKETGYVIFQDIKYQPLSFPVSFSARLALFNTPGFNSRLFVYENNLPVGYTTALFGSGIRSFIQLKYAIIKPLAIWFRYSTTNYFNQTTISSGLEQINGSIRHDINLQLNLKF